MYGSLCFYVVFPTYILKKCVMNRIPPLEFLSGTPKEAKTKKERGSPESQGKGCGSFNGRDRFGSHDDTVDGSEIRRLPRDVSQTL